MGNTYSNKNNEHTNNQKAMNSPKKRGGSTKYGKGGAKRKGRVIFSQSSGGMMKKGVFCFIHFSIVMTFIDEV